VAAGLSAAVIAERLGRSPEQVRARRRLLLGRGPAGRRYLSHEDEAIRLCVSQDGDLTALAYRLGRSPDALRLHAQHLGLHRPAPRRRWAEWEDAVIRDGYTSALPYSEIARQLPHRSATSLAARARKLDLITYARRWSSDDDARLLQLTIRGSTLEDVAQRLGRTPEAVRRHASRLGVSPPDPAPAPRHARRWTGEEDELLRLHHALNPGRLAELLGRSDAAVLPPAVRAWTACPCPALPASFGQRQNRPGHRDPGRPTQPQCNRARGRVDPSRSPPEDGCPGRGDDPRVRPRSRPAVRIALPGP
jgi:DNA-binding CsgD family transcriptional regulator